MIIKTNHSLCVRDPIFCQYVTMPCFFILLYSFKCENHVVEFIKNGYIERTLIDAYTIRPIPILLGKIRFLLKLSTTCQITYQGVKVLDMTCKCGICLELI